MTALRMRARDFLTDDQLADVRQRVTWKGVALIAHAWALMLGSMALFAWWPNPLTCVLAVLIIGSRQLGLAVLMHEGAHGGLARDQKPRRNSSVCGWPTGFERHSHEASQWFPVRNLCRGPA